MKTVFKSIPGHPNYEIDEFGNMFSLATGKYKKAHVGTDGYLILNVTGKKKMRVHRAVALAWNPNPENKSEVHHIDEDIFNNHKDNLQWVTKQEHREISRLNEQVAFKLSRAQVVEMRNEYSYEKESDLAKKYGVAVSTIYQIATGQTRKDVGGKISAGKPRFKKVVDISTGDIYESITIVSELSGHTNKNLSRWLMGERPNPTNFRYVGMEDVNKPYALKPNRKCERPLSLQIQLRKIIKKPIIVRGPATPKKPLLKFDLAGNVLHRYESIWQAAKEMGRAPRDLRKVVNGKTGYYKGFIYRVEANIDNANSSL